MKQASILFRISLFSLIVSTSPIHGLTIDVTEPPYNANGQDTGYDAAAFRNALEDLAAAGGGTLYIPAGEYFIGSKINIVNAHWNLTLLGEGKGVTNIVCRNSDGIFRADNDDNDSTLTVRDISFIARGGNAGTAISWLNEGISNSNNASLDIQNTDFKAHNRDTDYFQYGIRGRQLKNTILREVYVGSIYGPETTYSIGSIGIDIDSCENVNISFTYSKQSKDGIRLRNARGNIDFYRAITVRNHNGITVEGVPSATTNVTVKASHTNCRDFGITLKDIDSGVVESHLFYTEPGSTYDYNDLRIASSRSVTVHKNIFHTEGGAPRIPIQLEGSNSDIIVKRNLLNAHSNDGSQPPSVTYSGGASASQVSFFENNEIVVHAL